MRDKSGVHFILFLSWISFFMWGLVTENTKCLTLKLHPRLNLIKSHPYTLAKPANCRSSLRLRKGDLQQLPVINAAVFQTGLGFSARGELHVDFKRICFGRRAEVVARLAGLKFHVIRPWAQFKNLLMSESVTCQSCRRSDSLLRLRLWPSSDAVLHMSRIECKWAKSFVLPDLHSIRLMWSTASELGLKVLD